jgi:hypothetical protein
MSEEAEQTEQTTPVPEQKFGREAVEADQGWQVVVLLRRVRGRVRLSNLDRLVLVQLFRWFPSILKVLAGWGPLSQGWRTFLRNHAPEIAAMDLFVVPTVGFSLLYAFVIVLCVPKTSSALMRWGSA